MNTQAGDKVREQPDLPFFILSDAFSLVGHKHVMGPFERPEDQRVDRVLLDILFEGIIAFKTLTITVFTKYPSF